MKKTTNIINLADYRAKKDGVKQAFKDSLDNDAVMQRYNIKTPTIEERVERIRQTVERINKLMETK
jgi:hypothetical protein